MVDCAEKESVIDSTLSCSTSNERMSCPSPVPPHSLAVVPYDETVIPDFHRLERTFMFSNGHQVTIQQNWVNGGVAAVVWDAAVVLAEYLVNNSRLLSSHQQVIELGAGTGLVGIVASQLGANAILTDRSVVLKTLNDNIDLNRCNLTTGSIVARELSWGEDLHLYTQPFDIVLGADIIYIEETFDELLTTIRHLSNTQTTVLLSCRIRYERDRRFLDKLRQFFTVEELFYDAKRDVYIYSAIRYD